VKSLESLSGKKEREKFNYKGHKVHAKSTKVICFIVRI
jgi:hypothetical protein